MMKKALLLLIVLCSACSFFSQKPLPPSKPLVIVSAAPYIEIVKQIAGEKVFVQSIIPPDVDPHNFEPSPRDMGPLLHTALWIQVGEGFEPLLENRLKETTPSIHILNLPSVTKTLKGACHCHHHHHDEGHDIDTHYWLDPITVAHQAKSIAAFLTLVLPQEEKYFQERTLQLKSKLYALNKKLTEELAPFKGGVFLTTHKAYGYFCNRYHLIQIGIEPEDGKEMRSKEIQHVMEEAKEHKNELIGVLMQPQHVNRAAETIAATFKLPLFMVNPYEEDYIATINELATITKEYASTRELSLP